MRILGRAVHVGWAPSLMMGTASYGGCSPFLSSRRLWEEVLDDSSRVLPSSSSWWLFLGLYYFDNEAVPKGTGIYTIGKRIGRREC